MAKESKSYDYFGLNKDEIKKLKAYMIKEDIKLSPLVRKLIRTHVIQ